MEQTTQLEWPSCENIVERILDVQRQLMACPYQPVLFEYKGDMESFQRFLRLSMDPPWHEDLRWNQVGCRNTLCGFIIVEDKPRGRILIGDEEPVFKELMRSERLNVPALPPTEQRDADKLPVA